MSHNIKIKATNTESSENTIYNSIGHSVGNFQLNSNDSQLDISHLNSGVYFYHIKNGNKIIFKDKIIKN